MPKAYNYGLNVPYKWKVPSSVLKGDFQFKQFNHRRKDNIHKILYILAMGFNLAKLHNRIQSGRIDKTLFEIKEVA